MIRSKYFTLEELTRSDYAIRHEINNSPDEFITQNLQYLVDSLLDPIRHAIGGPIVVTSGYRCERLNFLIGGSSKSQHMAGLAADIKAVGMTAKDLFVFIRQHHDAMLLNQLDQCILEFNTWVHISASEVPRVQFLEAVKRNNKTTYLNVTN